MTSEEQVVPRRHEASVAIGVQHAGLLYLA